MRQSLLEVCEAQIRNETALRKADRFEFEVLIKFGAFMHVSAGYEIDVQRIKACKLVLQDRALIFARFREPLKYVLQMKMALSDDPAAFIEDVLAVYEQLREGGMPPSEVLAMVAVAIVENCPMDQRDTVVEKTIAEYGKVKGLSEPLANGPDMLLIVLAVLADREIDQVAGEVAELFRELKGKYRLESNAALYIAMVLAFCSKPVDSKVADFFRLFDACDGAGHATSADNLMVAYAVFADSEYDLGELVAAIGEVDEWLKKKKGYGTFGIGGHGRSLFAALLAFEDIEDDRIVVAPENANAADALVEEPTLILTMLILVFVVASKAR